VEQAELERLHKEPRAVHLVLRLHCDSASLAHAGAADAADHSGTASSSDHGAAAHTGANDAAAHSGANHTGANPRTRADHAGSRAGLLQVVQQLRRRLCVGVVQC